MPYLEWNEDLSVGVKQLDDQHKVLMATVNELHGAMAKGQGRAITADLLKTLVMYTREHFACEESLMRQSAFPEAADHKHLHDELTSQVQDYVKRFEDGEISLSVDLLQFLNQWLVKHIKGSDRKYGPWLNRQGIC